MLELAAIAFPQIPTGIPIGPVEIRFYALAYVAGLLFGWWLAKRICGKDELWGATRHPEPIAVDDLIVYIAFGIILGGRLGYVLFYDLPAYLDAPLEALKLWHGGMSFHGGLIGATLGVFLFARARRLPTLPILDLGAAVAPIGLFFGRVANFINGELFGRVTDIPWAMIFPHGGPEPRHPSQLYQAALEGVALFVLVQLLVRGGALKRPGLVAGLFAVGYGIARVIGEMFRQPDPQLGFLAGGLTMGMLLSVPMIALGLALAGLALKRRPAEA
ncbi:prolipoprotein diacylglyceryl transferase [Chelatococcus sambhunathii]|uniref:Phosphatidylglycerol--prolipoprotein diacylglyceryl transferase n=1 Tax=Chelatococcus sambhunathii TaxID=363953 RepID=A0ABU1DGV3_9HYPH|nr:prolipoprotein diacylglyceryl transferase [Chelatococcus sambhunathii]MDR4307349.1 prolipoprotein diacylglyceryl transferase [Chelatococcus sambhunathii]